MKLQLKMILTLVVMTGSLQAMAYTRDSESTVPWAPTQNSMQVTSDKQYVYFRRPLHLLMDHGQAEALKSASALVAAQLGKLTKEYDPSVDPTGDLKALVNGVDQFHEQMNQLVNLASTVYGAVDGEKSRWMPWLGEQTDPTGFMLYGTIEATDNVLNWLPIPFIRSIVQGGGSGTLAIVFVPMEVTRVAIGDTTATPEVYTEFDMSAVLIPVVNAGVGVTTTKVDVNSRFGVGLIWGQLNRASDVAGLTGGGSATIEFPQFSKILPDFLQAGVNLKFMTLKNPARAGMVNNVIAMFGLETGVTPTWNGATPLLNLKAQSHFNIGGIIDANSLFSGILNTGTGLIRRVVP